jgi:hypothetical protein
MKPDNLIGAPSWDILQPQMELAKVVVVSAEVQISPCGFRPFQGTDVFSKRGSARHLEFSGSDKDTTKSVRR